MECPNCKCKTIELSDESVCHNCGVVLSEDYIVSEVQFEERSDGRTNVLGQFVPSDATTLSTKYGSTYIGSQNSQQITLAKGKRFIQLICSQLQLNVSLVDIAHNFLKMAFVNHNFTRGRKRNVVYAACIYLTCRTEKSAYLLIDISDAAQVCSVELGRTYLKLSELLMINIPSVDPCLYVLRFAGQMEFEAKKHEVSQLALRLVQRMKRDNLHYGRRPSGICGAALLLAARYCGFNRTVDDIVRVVKIHHSTLKKRLQEFKETQSSSMTFGEFLSVDLEFEEDPPCFRNARKKDKSCVQKILEDNPQELDLLRKQIEEQLDSDGKKFQKIGKRALRIESDSEDDVDDVKNPSDEAFQHHFLNQATYELVEEFIIDNPVSEFDNYEDIAPDIDQICKLTKMEPEVHMKSGEEAAAITAPNGLYEEEVSDIDDNELNQYLLTDEEAANKEKIWCMMNEVYLNEQKNKKEAEKKGKDGASSAAGGEAKRKRVSRPRKKRSNNQSNTLSEALEQVIQDKRISSKINYDILKTLEEL